MLDDLKALIAAVSQQIADHRREDREDKTRIFEKLDDTSTRLTVVETKLDAADGPPRTAWEWANRHPGLVAAAVTAVVVAALITTGEVPFL